MEKKRIGIFGGTFNPIHSGHIRAAAIVQKKFSLNKVLFIPSFIPPHKEAEDIASPLHRLRMVELAVEGHSAFEASSVEIEAKERSYSIITLGKIRKLHPGADIFFIVGIDAFLEIDTWKDYKAVLDKCVFIVVSRPGYNLKDAYQVVEGKYSAKTRVYKENEGTFPGDDLFFPAIILFPMKALDIRSTEVRKNIREGDSIKGKVPDTVEEYIRKNKLYQRKK